MRECMELYAGLYRAPRGVDETLALVGLDAAARSEARRRRSPAGSAAGSTSRWR